MTSDEQTKVTAYGPRTDGPRPAKGYRDLLVWQKGIALVKKVYEISARFPVEERFGLTSQMRRATISIPSNIAEGQARKSTREFVQFISNAEGSLAELDSQMVIAQELHFLTASEAAAVAAQLDELRRMLNSLRRRLSGPRV